MEIIYRISYTPFFQFFHASWEDGFFLRVPGGQLRQSVKGFPGREGCIFHERVQRIRTVLRAPTLSGKTPGLY